MLTVLYLIRIHYVDKVKQHWVNPKFLNYKLGTAKVNKV